MLLRIIYGSEIHVLRSIEFICALESREFYITWHGLPTDVPVADAGRLAGSVLSSEIV